MKKLFASAFVIARRDYLATVLSRSFLLFILSPMLVIGFSGGIGFITATSIVQKAPPILAVVATADTQQADGGVAFRATYADLSHRLEQQKFENVELFAPQGDADTQAHALLTDTKHPARAVLVGLPGAPRLIGPKASLDDLRDGVKLALDTMHQNGALKKAGLIATPTALAEVAIDPAHNDIADKRERLAGFGKTLLFFLNMLLAGMMLSNLVEEKANKIIEILVAAVPIDAVFVGKMMGMLAVALTIVVAYAVLIGGGYVMVLSRLPTEFQLAAPAVGWPMFIVLGFAYFMMNYLVVGGIFLGIGAQANTPREVQTISMPATFAQMTVFIVASVALNTPHNGMWFGAAIFPLSTPLVMFAESARESALWPHLLALTWEALWVVIIVRFAGQRFRTNVLKSGPVRAKRV